MPPSGVRTLDWGRTAYADAFARQKVLVAQRKAGTVGDHLIFTEHAPVFTVGVRPGAQTHLLADPEILAREGITVEKTNRGGDITYHGPGQIVGYPIISLRPHRDLHAYLRAIEDVLIATLATYGLQTGRREGKTGVWIGERKLAAIGVAVSSWVTYHGFAVNVDPDLRHFDYIVPCGITDGSVTSLALELGHAPDLAEVKARLAENFRQKLAPLLEQNTNP